MNTKWFISVVVGFALLLCDASCGAFAQAKRSKGKTTNVVKKAPVRTTDMRIVGSLVDSESGVPLPFSNVFVRRTLIGTLTDEDGRFSLLVPPPHDTVWFSAMGYTESFVLLSKLKPSEADSLNVKLKPENVAIDEVLVKPDDAPRRLLKAVVARKDANNPDNHQRTDFEKYVRWQYSLSNISDRAQGNWLFKDAQNLLQVSESDSSKFLPVYFSETLSHNEFQKNPRKAKCSILADRTKGVDIFKQYEIGGFASSLDNEVNFYDDVVKIMGVGFVSPIAKDCFRYYDYFIIDSVNIAPMVGEVDSVKVYTVRFRPKHEGDKVFRGTMDIETRHFSPMSVDAHMPKWTNINFVKKLHLFSSFRMVEDTVPFFSASSMDAEVDYMPVASDKKRLGIRCEMYSSLSDVKVSALEPLELSKKTLAVETVKSDGYKQMGDDFWDERRHGEMTDSQRAAGEKIDSLNNVGSVKAFNYLAKAAMTGFVDVGPVEIGPVGEMFNTNKIEGVHLGVGLRSSKEVSEQWVVSGIIGYGFRNSRLTYGAGLGYRFRTPMRQAIEVDYSDRLYKIGEDENILYLYENMLSTSETNIVAQLFKREVIDELFYCQKLRLRYDMEWLTGFQTRLQASVLRQESPEFYPFTQGGKPIGDVKQAEASLDFRFSFREKFIDDGLQRVYVSTDFPIFHVTVAGGLAEAGEKRSSYARVHTTLKHLFRLGQTKLDIAVENGAFFGSLPYSLLNIARGNKTYGFYRYDFNLMNYLEFVCDKYVYLHADYSLDGLLFHKIPFLHKAGLREVVGAKIMYGSLSNRHVSLLDLPDGVGGPSKPYAEVNVGFDNIFRFFRVDYIYKVVGECHGNSPRMGVRFQLNFKF